MRNSMIPLMVVMLLTVTTVNIGFQSQVLAENPEDLLTPATPKIPTSVPIEITPNHANQTQMVFDNVGPVQQELQDSQVPRPPQQNAEILLPEDNPFTPEEIRNLVGLDLNQDTEVNIYDLVTVAGAVDPYRVAFTDLMVRTSEAVKAGQLKIDSDLLNLLRGVNSAVITGKLTLDEDQQTFLARLNAEVLASLPPDILLGLSGEVTMSRSMSQDLSNLMAQMNENKIMLQNPQVGRALQVLVERLESAAETGSFVIDRDLLDAVQVLLDAGYLTGNPNANKFFAVLVNDMVISLFAASVSNPDMLEKMDRGSPVIVTVTSKELDEYVRVIISKMIRDVNHDGSVDKADLETIGKGMVMDLQYYYKTTDQGKELKSITITQDGKHYVYTPDGELISVIPQKQYVA